MTRLKIWGAIVLAGLTVQCGSGTGDSSSSGSSGSSSGTNSLTGTVQAPPVGIFGNLAAPGKQKGLGLKGVNDTAVGGATVCAYNTISGKKLGCAATDSNGKYTIEGFAKETAVDPNNTAKMRIAIQAEASDGKVVLFDYEDGDFTAGASAGTANGASTNAFVKGPLTELRKNDSTWLPGTAAPSAFVDKLKAGTFDPACKFIPYAAAFTDGAVAIGGGGLGGTLGVINDMAKAAISNATWKTLGYSNAADFAYDAMSDKLTTAQINTWAADVADDLSTTAENLAANFTAAMTVLKSVETIFGSVLAGDVGLSERSGRTATFCKRLITDAETREKWVDTLVKYDTTETLEKHWGSSAAFSAAAKFVEEFDDDDVWSKFDPDVLIGFLGSDFTADDLTDDRVNTAALLLSKGAYSDLTDAASEDVGHDAWKMIMAGSTSELATFRENPAFWIGYAIKYHDELTGSDNFSELVDDVIDDADDVAAATCESDPTACVTLADAESPDDAAIPTIAATYTATFGTATSNTCATGSVSCTHGTVVIAQNGTELTCKYTPTGSATSLSDTAGTASSTVWSCSPTRSGQSSGNCVYAETAALTGVPSPFSASTTTITLTRASTATAADCLGVINSSLSDTTTSCSFKCTTTLTAQ